MHESFDLQRKILEELEFEPHVDAAKIGVAVDDGVVTLTGCVDTYAERLGVEAAAKRVRGVKAVVEQVEVRVPSRLRRSDADIARAAVDALEWNTLVPSAAIQVRVEDGWITLEGEVTWAHQHDAAADAVRDLQGVRGVTNQIVVKPRLKVQQIREHIVEAFRRSAELDAAGIAVEANDGHVTLTGSVHSVLEREEAARVAWAAPGVSAVDNQITVT